MKMSENAGSELSSNDHTWFRMMVFRSFSLTLYVNVIPIKIGQLKRDQPGKNISYRQFEIIPLTWKQAIPGCNLWKKGWTVDFCLISFGRPKLAKVLGIPALEITSGA